MTSMRSVLLHVLAISFALALALPSWAEEPDQPAAAAATPPAAGTEPKPWDQEAVAKLAEDFAKRASEAYTAIYNQGGTTGSLASGQRRDFFRLRDKARIIDREARHYRSAIKDGKGLDETYSIFERLMVEVRGARVVARRVMIQEDTQKKIAAAGAVLQQISDYYDPAAFFEGPQAPLNDPEFGATK